MTRIEPHMTEALAKHRLVCLVNCDDVHVYDMHREGTRCYKLELIFVPEGIAILGDLEIGSENGVCCHGYDLEWFVGDLSERYLAEKFLRQQWCPDLARERVEEMIATPGDYGIDPAKVGELEYIRDNLTNDASMDRCFDALAVAGYDLSDGCPGFGYSPAEVGWLAAVQQRFAALYAETEKACLASGV